MNYKDVITGLLAPCSEVQELNYSYGWNKYTFPMRSLKLQVRTALK